MEIIEENQVWHSHDTPMSDKVLLIKMEQSMGWEVTTARLINNNLYYEYMGKLYPWKGVIKWAYIELLEEKI